MSGVEFPTIGDYVLSGWDYILDEKGDNKYSLLDAEASDEITEYIVSGTRYPSLYEKVGVTYGALSSPSVILSYKIVADLPVSIETTLANLGDIILSDLDYLYDANGDAVYSLLDQDGSTYDTSTYPQLYALIGTDTLEAMTAPTNSPFGYKRVADLVEE